MSFLLWMLERSDWLTFAASTEANENREDVGDDDAATAVCPRDRDRLWCLASRGLSCKQKDSKVQRKFLFFLMVKRLDKFWKFFSCFSFAFVNAILTHFWSARTTASEGLGETGSKRVARDEIGGLNLDATSATFFTVVNTFGILSGIVIGFGVRWNWL